MANPRHVALLKKGKTAWNSWRLKRPSIGVDLSHADLAGLDLSGNNDGSMFDSRYNLASADFRFADLRGTNLNFSLLVASNLRHADLRGAKMTNAFCNSCDFTFAKLNNLQAPYIDLIAATLAFTSLAGSKLNNAFFGMTVFAQTNLKGVTGLSTCKHCEPSAIDLATIETNPSLPKNFLVDCGLDHEAADRLLLLAARAKPIPRCFISYSSKDERISVRSCTLIFAKPRCVVGTRLII